jgi:hypothetical protein
MSFSLEHFEIKKIHVGMAVMLGIMFGIFQFQCNSWKAQKAANAEAEAAAADTSSDTSNADEANSSEASPDQNAKNPTSGAEAE